MYILYFKQTKIKKELFHKTLFISKNFSKYITKITIFESIIV